MAGQSQLPLAFLPRRSPFLHTSKFLFGSEAWGNRTWEMYYSLLSLKMISFVLFPQASEPSINFNISKLVC